MDQILSIKTGECVGFGEYRRSYLLWSSVVEKGGFLFVPALSSFVLSFWGGRFVLPLHFSFRCYGGP